MTYDPVRSGKGPSQGYWDTNPEYYGKQIHGGTDYSTKDGFDKVYGLEGWKILDTYKDYNLGNVMVIVNPNTGERIKYAHLAQTFLKRGDQIPNNDTVIAKAGNTGRTIKGKQQMPHLHVEYENADGKKADITTSALMMSEQKAQQNNPLIKMPKIVKEANATDGEPIPGATPRKNKQELNQELLGNTNLKAEQDPNAPGSYNGKTVGTYQIKPGDTLSALAKQYKTTVADFQRLNPQITNPNVIYSGKSLNVPSASTQTNKSSGYTIRSGDTLTSIARNLGTTVNDLVRKNGIQDPNRIRAGATIKW